MFNNSSMTSSIDHEERSFIKHKARLNPSPDTDPWCLFCKTNLKTEHLPYKDIFDERLLLDRLIESRLGLELDATLPSAFLCYRCEKELQRMSWRDSTARGDMQSKLESNLHLWPPQSSLPAPGEGGTVSAKRNSTSEHRRLFTKDAVSSSTFDSLEARAASHAVTMTSRESRDGKEEIQAGKVEKKEKEDHDGEEEDDEDEGTLDDTTTYILYSTPTGTLETRLLSHESSWSPSRKRKEGKSRSSSRHSSGGSDKYSHLESSSLPRDSTFGDQLSLSASSRLNKTDLSSGQDSNFNELVSEQRNLEMSVPESSTFRTSSVTTSRLWEPSEKQEREDTLVDDDEDSRESEEDAVTTTTTTTTTTTMTTPKGTTQWTKTTIKTIWDDVDEQEEMEEVAVEVATPSTPLPSSTEAAVAAASAATKKAFSHSPDTRRRRREHRHSNKENNEEDYRADEKRKKSDQAGQWSEKRDDNYQSANLDMDTSTRTTQYYDCSRMDSGRPRSLQLAGDHLGNVCLYRGNYGDVSRDFGEKEEKDKIVSSEVDTQFMSPENAQYTKFLHSTPVYSANDWTIKKDEQIEYYSNNNEEFKETKMEADYYYIEKKEKKENVNSSKEEKEEKEERNRRKERSEYYPSQHYERQDTVVCREFPYLPSPDLQTSNYRNDVEVGGSGRVDDGFRPPHGDQKETIINSSLTSLGYQSTEFNSGYLPHNYPDNRGRNVKEHWSTTSTANSYVGVDIGQIHKDEGRAATIGWTDSEPTTKPVENDSYLKDPDPTQLSLTGYTNFNFDQEEDSNEEMYPADQGSHQFWDKASSSKKYGKGGGGGGGGGGNDDPRASDTSSPSHLRRQGSKESRSSGRHRKRRHKGRKRDRSRDSENSNDSSSSSNPVVQNYEEFGSSVKEFDCTHYEEQDNSRKDEEGVGATATAVCSEQVEESVLPSGDWYGKVEETKGGDATSRQLWTTATVGSDIGGGARCTPSPEIDHLPYKLYSDDYRRSYYDNDGGDGGGGGGVGGGGGGGGNNSSSNNKYEREEKTLDQDNNNVLNNSNDEFCNAERESTRVTGTEACVTSTYDSLEARPESYIRTDDHYRQGDSEKKDTVLFSAPYHGQTSGFAELASSLGNQQLSYPSSLHWDSATQAVCTTQSDTDYISSTSYSYQHIAPYTTFSSPAMDNQDDNRTNDDTSPSDTNAIYTDNPITNDDLNADTNFMPTNNDINDSSTIGEYSGNIDSNQADFGEAFGGDANLTATSSDQNEANRETLPKADSNETATIRDDYDSYHGEIVEANSSEVKADFTSSFNAFETSDKMEPRTTNDADEVQDLEDAPSAGGWEGYKDNRTSDEQMMSLNDEIAQADQNTNWNNTFEKEKDDEDSPKFDAWNQGESDPRPNTGDAENESKDYSKDYDKDFDNEKAEGQVDIGGYDNDYNQNHKEDTVKYTGFDAEEGKNFSETFDKDPDLTEPRQDDTVNDTYIQQNDTEKYSSYDDDRPLETGYIRDNQDYKCETADYGDDYNATNNMEENSYYNAEYGGDSRDVVDNFEERQNEPQEDGSERQENITDYKIEEEVDHENNEGEYNMEQSPVEWGTSYSQDIKADSYGPDAQEMDYFCEDNNNMVDTGNQDDTRNQQDETEIDRVTTEEYPWQTTPSPPTESTAKRPMDLHLLGSIYNETNPMVEQGGNVEDEPSVETRNTDYIVSSPREEVQHSPYDSPGQRNEGEEVVVTESPADRGSYWMDETTGGRTDQEGETLGVFQEDSATAINETSMSPTAAMGQEDTGIEEQISMVQIEAVEVPIVPEIRPSIPKMYDGRQPSYDGEQPSLDDSRYTSMYDRKNENVITPESKESYLLEPAWGSVRSHYETEMEIGGVIEARQEIVEETLIVPSIRDRNDRYPYGYSSMMNDAIESRDTLDSEGQLSAPVAVLESSTDLGNTTFPCGSSEYQDVSAGDSNNALAATSVSGSFLDVPNNTEQKRWDSFESSKNKVPSTFGVEPHVERLRYGIRVRSGRAATSAGRKKDDQKPLIGSEWRPLDGKEFDDRDGDSGFWTPDTENDDTQETDTMPFGFGKKKKNESLIEKDVSPIAQPSKEVESAGTTIVEKIEEVAFSAEDAVIDHTEQVTVTMTETVVEEEAVVEVVTSDAVDGGAEQLVEIEQTVEREIDEMGENTEKESEMEEVAIIMEEKDESIIEDLVMVEEPKVIGQIVAEDKEMELVLGYNTVDLDIAHEVMSVDLNELEDDEEVAILDRFEMLGQVEGEKDEVGENIENDPKTEEVTAETKEVTAETKEVTAETKEAETEEKDESTKEEIVMTQESEVNELVAVEDKEFESITSEDNAADSAVVTNEATSVELNEMEDVEEPVEPVPVEIVEEKNVVETPAPVVEKQPKKQPRVESTPLIGKSTKVKDTQPGFLCCTIL